MSSSNTAAKEALLRDELQKFTDTVPTISEIEVLERIADTIDATQCTAVLARVLELGKQARLSEKLVTSST